MKHLFYLIAGGGAGAVARYALSEAVHRAWGKTMPYGTFAVNIIGCLLLGFLVVMSETRFHLRPGFRVLLIAGFCGAFTTFSSFIFEISGLIESGHSVKALSYLLMSVTVGFLFFRLGIVMTQRIF